jgi:putative sugar O-methyltransferase
MYSIQFFQKCVDFVFRSRNYSRRKLKKKTLFSSSNQESDSQATFYQNAVSTINANSRAMRRFRRVYDYREILEHVDYSLGRKYIEHANLNDPQVWSSLNEFKRNDLLGNPRTFYFEEIGRISPTTLRYIAVATDIRREFGNSKLTRIVEIGGGYGGQAAILLRLNMWEEYFIFDLPEVQDLIQQYLSFIGIGMIDFPKISTPNSHEYDLVISNYAFSELPRKIQDEYLDKVILKARRGFMLMNSGKSDATGRSDGKISVEELRRIIPNLRELPEIPLTSPDNYLLVWQN